MKLSLAPNSPAAALVMGNVSVGVAIGGVDLWTQLTGGMSTTSYLFSLQFVRSRGYRSITAIILPLRLWVGWRKRA